MTGVVGVAIGMTVIGGVVEVTVLVPVPVLDVTDAVLEPSVTVSVLFVTRVA